MTDNRRGKEVLSILWDAEDKTMLRLWRAQVKGIEFRRYMNTLILDSRCADRPDDFCEVSPGDWVVIDGEDVFPSDGEYYRQEFGLKNVALPVECDFF